MKKTLIIIFAIALFISCEKSNEEQKKSKINSDYLELSTLWYQISAEKRALSYQTYNIAKYMLKENKANKKTDKPSAIVLDIDETVLDNSPFQAKRIIENFDYSKKSWFDWSSQIMADTLAGVGSFLNFAKNSNVEIFYISNRRVKELDWTIENLKKKGLPNADKEHVILRTTTSNKEERRQQVIENYEIIMFFGDNLGDFNEEFEDRTENFAFDKVDKYKNDFGVKYIVLPNPMYGSWEMAIYDKDMTNEEKQKMRKENLKIGY